MTRGRRSPHPPPGLKILSLEIAGSAQSRRLLTVPSREDAAARSATWPQHQSRVSHGRHTAVVGAALPPPLRHSRGAAKSPPSRGVSYTRRTRFTSLPQGQGDPGEGRLLRNKWRSPDQRRLHREMRQESAPQSQAVSQERTWQAPIERSPKQYHADWERGFSSIWPLSFLTGSLFGRSAFDRLVF